MAVVSAAVPARLRGAAPGILFVAAAPVALAVSRLLPAEGLGLAVRLAAASACLLLLPGAVILRAFAWPASPALAVTGSFVLSLAVGFLAFAVAFGTSASLTVVLALVAAAALAALVPAARAVGTPVARAEWIALGLVVAAAVLFAGVVWWVSQTLGTGDALFHTARARKLADADALSSVGVANEFRDGGLHPGYAFPLWHGELAGIARLGGVDVADVVLHLGSALVPIAFVVSYAAGAQLFRSWAGGVAVLAATVAQLGFTRGGTGSFTSLALPASVTRIVLIPALLALVFAFLRDGRPRDLVAIAAAALAVAVIHPTYLVFVAVLLVAFAAVRVATVEERRAEALRFGAAAAAVAVPAIAFFAWLAPTISDTASHRPTATEESRALAHYGDQVEVVGDDYRAAPGSITRAGPVVVAGLLVVPLLALLARRRWSAYAAAGTVVVLAVLVVPEVFARFSDLVSVSQSRRLAQFLPVAFAVGGAAVLAARARALGVVLALGLGLVLQLAYGGSGETAGPLGPSWPVWLALVGGAVGLIAAVVLRRRLNALTFEPTRWAALAGIAFTIPLAVGGFADLERADTPDSQALTPGVVEELRRLDDDDVVFAPVETAYRVAAFANVYAAALPASHVADTEANRPYRRQRDVLRFFAPGRMSDPERRALLRDYDADWLLVDLTLPYPRTLVASLPRAYGDARYALFRVDA
jgi:hypothetical protein